MAKIKCELCAFENPKPTATALIIKDGNLLVAKRNIEPFKGQWDFIGGYCNKDETPKDCLLREIKEELNVTSILNYIGAFSGTGSYKQFNYPILSFAYLAEINGTITLDKENSAYTWVPIRELYDVAFDSNINILKYAKDHLYFPLDRVRELTQQLDSSATVNEQSLYRATLNGHVATIYEKNELIGMGWIFPRQTMLRRQAVVEDMIVDEKHRGKGLGWKILEDLLQWAHNNAIEVVELTSNPKRLAANGLYKKFGFKLHPTNHYLYSVT